MLNKLLCYALVLSIALPLVYQPLSTEQGIVAASNPVTAGGLAFFLLKSGMVYICQFPREV